MTEAEYAQRLKDMVAQGTPRKTAKAILRDMDDVVTKDGQDIPGPVLDEPANDERNGA
jgi:hypothetical protein